MSTLQRNLSKGYQVKLLKEECPASPAKNDDSKDFLDDLVDSGLMSCFEHKHMTADFPGEVVYLCPTPRPKRVTTWVDRWRELSTSRKFHLLS